MRPGPKIAARVLATLHDEGVGALAVKARVFVHSLLLDAGIWIVERLPHTRRLVDRYFLLKRRLWPTEYTDARATKFLWIDPARIRHVSSLERPIDRNSVQGGDWDRETRRFDEQPVPRAIEQRVQQGVRWEETPLRELFDHEMDVGGSEWGYDHREQFADRCAELTALIERIRTMGYRPKRELGKVARSNDPTLWFLDEPSVDIGRDGQLLWRDFGQHRLAIARVLGVEAIPVYVIARHRQWQEIRESPSELARYDDHPDLRDLHNRSDRQKHCPRRI